MTTVLHLDEIEEDLMVFPDFPKSLIGVTQRMNGPMLAVYSYEQMIDEFIHEHDTSYEGAVEYLDHNTLCAWFGDRTPIIVMGVEH